MSLRQNRVITKIVKQVRDRLEKLNIPGKDPIAICEGFYSLQRLYDQSLLSVEYNNPVRRDYETICRKHYIHPFNALYGSLKKQTQDMPDDPSPEELKTIVDILEKIEKLSSEYEKEIQKFEALKQGRSPKTLESVEEVGERYLRSINNAVEKSQQQVEKSQQQIEVLVSTLKESKDLIKTLEKSVKDFESILDNFSPKPLDSIQEIIDFFQQSSLPTSDKEILIALVKKFFPHE